MTQHRKEEAQLKKTRHAKVQPAWKANLTYVTDADLAVQAYLHRAPDAAFPDDGVVSLELDMPAHAVCLLELVPT